MATVSLRSVGLPSSTPSSSFAEGLVFRLRLTPLIPVALALTGGMILDRSTTLPLLASVITLVAGLLAWAACWMGQKTGLAKVYLGLVIVAFGAGYYHWRRDILQPDNISYFAFDEPRLVRLRGTLASEPIVVYPPPPHPLDSYPDAETSRANLTVASLKQGETWTRVSGNVRLVVEGRMPGLHVCDEVEVMGKLILPEPPSNPGEFDYAARLQDRGIQAVVNVSKTPNGVQRLNEGWKYSPLGWLAVIRGWSQGVLQEKLPKPESGVATALLLGEGSMMTRPEYEKYLRTGVIHILVISGQHLTVLAWFAWGILRVLGVRRRWGAGLVILFLVSYTLLTGAQPPILRAAVVACLFCGSIVFRRAAHPANTLALAWIVVAILNPGDIFTLGCQLSFLAVVILVWGIRLPSPTKPDPLQQLLEESRPTWERWLRAGGRWVLRYYLLNVLVWVAVAPLAAARYHLVSPPALLITPPMLLLSSIALIAGFLLLFFAAFLLLVSAVVFSPAVSFFAWITSWSLRGCETLVDFADRMPGAFWYVSDVPEVWLWLFYLGLFAVMVIEPLRRRWAWIALAWMVWFCFGLLGDALRRPEPELRCTFLAVGHGGCTVIETPEGRVLLYDAGTMYGPDVARKQIAPFLWHRGIRRIDEVLLSHAHLDHYNGLVDLLDRFSIGQVTCTPTFAEKPGPGTRFTLAALQKRGIPIRIVKAGDRLTVGSVEMEVLHPPPVGPAGSEDARSLVLLIRHEGHSILLTGDLQGEGTSLPAIDVDILMAPHHGGRLANPETLAKRMQPEIVIASQGRPQWPNETSQVYEKTGARFLGTWPHGAITIRSRRDELVVETFRTGERYVLRSGPGGSANRR